jgi:hypothetical protein
MNRTLTIGAIALLTLSFGCSKPPDTAKRDAAIASVQQVQASIDIGTNITNYRDRLTTAKADMNAYLSEPGAVDGEAGQRLQAAMTGYELALSYWQCDLEQAGSASDTYIAIATCRDRVLPSIMAQYPDIKAKVEEATQGSEFAHRSSSLDKTAVIQLIWQHSGEAVQQAQALN